MSTTTEFAATATFKIGDRVQVRDENILAPYTGTVIDIRLDPLGQPLYTVRKVDPDTDYDLIAQSDLEPDETGFLDLDDIGQIRAELADSAAHLDADHSPLGSAALERIREATRIAHLASRLAWLETCDLQKQAGTDDAERTDS